MHHTYEIGKEYSEYLFRLNRHLIGVTVSPSTTSLVSIRYDSVQRKSIKSK